MATKVLEPLHGPGPGPSHPSIPLSLLDQGWGLQVFSSSV